jgi:hypothetical protein
MTFFLSHASSVASVVFLFRGLSGVGFRAVKVFTKNTTRSLRRAGDFLQNPQGLTLTVREKPVSTFALKTKNDHTFATALQ